MLFDSSLSSSHLVDEMVSQFQPRQMNTPFVIGGLVLDYSEEIAQWVKSIGENPFYHYFISQMQKKISSVKENFNDITIKSINFRCLERLVNHSVYNFNNGKINIGIPLMIDTVKSESISIANKHLLYIRGCASNLSINGMGKVIIRKHIGNIIDSTVWNDTIIGESKGDISLQVYKKTNIIIVAHNGKYNGTRVINYQNAPNPGSQSLFIYKHCGDITLKKVL